MIDRGLLASAIDLILVLVVLEGCGLVLLRRATGRGPHAIVAMLAAGFFLMLATRLALGNVSAGPIAACLLAALVAHLGDLVARWQARGKKERTCEPGETSK